MMFFKKKHKKKKNKGGKCYDTSNCMKSKTKKRFGLTSVEMDDLLLQMICKPKIPIESVN